MVGETVGDQIGEEPAAVDLSFAVFSDCGSEVASRIVRIVVVALQLIPNHVGKERVLAGFEPLVEIGLVLGYGFGHAGKGVRSLKPREVNLGHGFFRLSSMSDSNARHTCENFLDARPLSLVLPASRPHEKSLNTLLMSIVWLYLMPYNMRGCMVVLEGFA